MPSVNLGRVSIVPKGAWSNSNSYEKLDVVTYGGGSYIANKDVPAGTSLTTTEYWSNFVGSFNIGTVETVSASTGASAELITTSTGQTLNLQIPRGVAGNESIDDTKGEGDTDYVWSADKSWNEVNNLDIDINGKANAIEKTASGDIVSFDDGADNQYVKSLKVNIEPVQDLHGYDYPWPAGGGKNLTSYTTAYTPTVEVNNGQIAQFTLTLDAGTYTFSCKQSATLTTSLRNTIGVVVGNSTYQWENSTDNYNPPNLRHVKTFTVTETSLCTFYTWEHSPATAITLNEWQVEKSDSFTSYTPYANICPIQGYTKININQNNGNLLTNDINSFTTTGAYKFYYSGIPDGNHLYMSFEDNDTSISITGISFGYATSENTTGVMDSSQFRWCIQNGNISRHENIANDNDTNHRPCSFFIYPSTSTALQNLFKRYKIMVNFGDEPQEYVSPQTINKQINLGTTTYGGEIYPIEGKINKTYGYISSYNGESLPSTWLSDRDAYVPETTPTIGAEVVYKLSEPLEESLSTSYSFTSFLKNNNFIAEGKNLSITYRVETQEYIDNIITSINNIKNETESILIENYTRFEQTPVNIAPYYKGYGYCYINSSGWDINTQSTAYIYWEIPTDILKEEIKLNGFSGTGIKTAIFVDKNNNLISYYPKENIPAPGQDIEIECKVPLQASKLYLTGTINSNVWLKNNSPYYKSNDNVSQIGQLVGSQYYIGTNEIKNVIELNGSNNNLFCFKNIRYNNEVFKTAGDDIAPINLNGIGYVGANHGYNFAYECETGIHGCTNNDIGKTYTANNNTFILIKIIDTTKLLIMCYNNNVWTKVRTATIPNTLNFGTELTVTSSTLKQLHPSVKNGKVEIIENNSEKFTILETYDIIDLGTGLDSLIANVGNNTNDSIVELSNSAFTIRNIYDFLNNGAVTIYSNIKVLNPNASINYIGNVQSQALTVNDYFAVPQTIYNDYRSIDGRFEFTRNTWTSTTTPPVLYIQGNDSASTATKFMLTGYITENRNDLIASTTTTTNAGFIANTTRKMYPSYLNINSAKEKNTIFDIIAFRIPIVKNLLNNKVSIYGYTKVYNDYYLFICPDSAIDNSIEVPDCMRNRKAEIYMTDGVTCNTKNVIDSVDIQSNGRGYLILKLSK